MIIDDLFRLNDWSIKKFTVFIFSLLIAYDSSFVSSISLNNTSLYNLKLLSQILGFVILTFIPGYIILRIFRIHHIDRIVNFLLAFSLSLSFIMIGGLCTNLFLPHIGISKPISTLPVFCALNGAILILLIISYFRDKGFSSSQNQISIILSPMTFFLAQLPLLSIFGTYFMNYYDFNAPVMIFLFIVSLFPILVSLGKISKNLHPFMIFSTSISLLLNLNLISTHIWGYDIFFEAYSSSYVLQSGIWNLSTESTIPLLLFTILVPTYSLLCDMNIIWVFKIIFPILFSFTPVILYQIYQKLDFGDFKLDSEMSILSVFLFIFFYGFFKNMPDKEHFAELFLTAILMLSINNTNPQNKIFLLIFSFSLIASHYGISYLFMLSLILAFIMIKFTGNKSNYILKSNYVNLFSIMAISWFAYISSGYIFKNFVLIGYHFISSIIDLLEPDNRSGVTYLFYQSKSIFWSIYKLFNIIIQILIFAGFLSLLTSIRNKKNRSLEISLIMIVFYLFIIVQTIKTYNLGFDRAFQISLILLSPLSLWGSISIIKTYNNLSRYIVSIRVIPDIITKKLNPVLMHISISNRNNKKDIYQKVRLGFAIFLMIFFLFNSGFLFELVGDSIPAYCINLNNSAGWPVYSESEICGVNWLKHNENGHSGVAIFNEWAGIKSREGLLISEDFYVKNLIPIQANTTSLDKAYIFLGKYSLNIVEEANTVVDLKNTKFYNYILKKSGKIYDSGKSNLYLN